MPKRLPEDAVLFIRRYHRAGYRVTTIAGALGVSRKAVSRSRQWPDAQDHPRLGSPTTPAREGRLRTYSRGWAHGRSHP